MEWLHANQAAVEVVFASASFFTLMIVVVFNFRANQTAGRAIDQARRMREMEMRPYVYFKVIISPPHGIVDFVLINKGRASARKVRLHLQTEVKVLNRKDEQELAREKMAIYNEVSVLAPGEQFSEMAGFAHTFFKNNDKELIGAVQYLDVGGRAFEEPIRINLELIGKRRNIQETTFSEVIETVERMERDLSMYKRR